MPRFYPVLQEKELRLVQQLIDHDPGYLHDPTCPYAEDIKKILRPKSAEQESLAQMSGPAAVADAEIMKEINGLYTRLKDYWLEVKDSDKSADKNTFFRVSTTLLEKIIELRERMSNLSQVNAFTSEVLTIMEEIMTPDQRNVVEERLRKFNDVSIQS